MVSLIYFFVMVIFFYEMLFVMTNMILDGEA